MEIAIIVLAAAAIAALIALAWASASGGKGEDGDDPKARAWSRFLALAEEVGGLAVVEDDLGWPTMRGLIDGVTVEVDLRNPVGIGARPQLGMRARLPEAEHVPSAALFMGEIEELRRQFGRPRPSGDPHGLFEVYTRVEPSASDWWQDPDLHEALTALPGGGAILVDGQLTVVFANLDADSIRQALTVPALIQKSVQRVTLH
ncbi:MAG: hypothetical protein AB7S26_38865 [Sandaracinaceae bacterium]